MRARWTFTDRGDGDFAASVDREELDERCRSLVDAPWTLLTQVHGATVVLVDEPGGHYGAEADAAVTKIPGAVLAVRTADCAGVVMIGSDAASDVVAVGVAHAGWKGLLAGVLQNTVAAMRQLGSVGIEWHLGPCISARHYEFGAQDLDRLVQRYGPTLASMTPAGRPALDMQAGVARAMEECDGAAGPVARGAMAPLCTASDDRYYSWRSRRDSGRQITAVWLEE